jgi:hypothetical protein
MHHPGKRQMVHRFERFPKFIVLLVAIEAARTPTTRSNMSKFDSNNCADLD